MLYSMILPFCHYQQVSFHQCLELYLSVFRSDDGVRAGRRSLVEPVELVDPSQSGMVLEVPSLDLLVTR